MSAYCSFLFNPGGVLHYLGMSFCVLWTQDRWGLDIDHWLILFQDQIVCLGLRNEVSL
jgi:hypothetical protein